MRSLPPLLRDRLNIDGKRQISELHLRVGAMSSVTYSDGEGARIVPLPRAALTVEELHGILGGLCGGSVHTYDEGLRRGYFSPMEMPGVRVGVGGRLLCRNGMPDRLQQIRTLCIRFPSPAPATRRMQAQLLDVLCGTADFSGRDASLAPDGMRVLPTLLYAPPGVGKTTALRGILRALTSGEAGMRAVNAAVVDTSGELWEDSLSACCADVLTEYPRGMGLSLAVRAFAPQVVLCDEIGCEEEAEAILRAQAGGVPLIATAHAHTLAELLCRPCFSALHRSGVFAQYVRLFRQGNAFSFLREEAV